MAVADDEEHDRHHHYHGDDGRGDGVRGDEEDENDGYYS